MSLAFEGWKPSYLDTTIWIKITHNLCAGTPRHCSWSRRNHTWWQHRQIHNANTVRKRGLAEWVFHQGEDQSQREDDCFTVGLWGWGSVHWSSRKTKWEEAEGSEMIDKPLLAGSFPNSPMRGICWLRAKTLTCYEVITLTPHCWVYTKNFTSCH